MAQNKLTPKLVADVLNRGDAMPKNSKCLKMWPKSEFGVYIYPISNVLFSNFHICCGVERENVFV